MNTETDSTNSLIADLLAKYGKILADANEYLDREARTKAAGITYCAAHRWAVVIDDTGCGSSVSLDNKKLCIKVVPGHLCGISLYTRLDANNIAAAWAEWAPSSIKKVKVMLDIDLVKARKADAENQIAFLSNR